MIPGSTSGQLLIEHKINKVEPVARSSLVYPLDEVAALSLGMELVSSELETVFRPVYLFNTGERTGECATINNLTASVNLRILPLLPLQKEATAITGISASVNLRVVPQVTAQAECSEITDIAVVSYRLAGVALEKLEDTTYVSDVSVTTIELVVV